MSARLVIVALLLATVGPAAAQGVQVRTWGTYDRYPYPPAFGGTYGYSPYPPMVTVLDQWGRVVEMPLQPKLLYYDSAIWTPQGWHRPTSIAVMPDKRPRYYSVPPRLPDQVHATPLSVPERKTAAPALPNVELPPVTRPIPTVPAPNMPRDTKPSVPAVPDLPKLPDVPRAPGVAPEPKLGPSPM